MKFVNNRIFLVNVGLNSKQNKIHKVLKKGSKFPPIFPDNSFLFFPIPVSRGNTTYYDLGLGDWVPNKFQLVHNDPNFEEFTYGNFKNTSRISNIKKASQGDILAFFGSFQKHSMDFIPLENEGAFYFIGIFEIELVYDSSHKIPSNLSKVMIWKIEKALKEENLFKGEDDTIVWIGSEKSELFPKAVIFDINLAYKLLGEFSIHRTEFNSINSKTRSTIEIFETRRRYFWEEIRKRNPKLKIFGPD